MRLRRIVVLFGGSVVVKGTGGWERMVEGITHKHY